MSVVILGAAIYAMCFGFFVALVALSYLWLRK